MQFGGLGSPKFMILGWLAVGFILVILGGTQSEYLSATVLVQFWLHLGRLWVIFGHNIGESNFEWNSGSIPGGLAQATGKCEMGVPGGFRGQGERYRGGSSTDIPQPVATAGRGWWICICVCTYTLTGRGLPLCACTYTYRK